MRFAVDTGGTFTDLVVEDNEGLCRLFKARTTPHDPIEGVLASLKMAADHFGCPLDELLAKGDILVHGTTHALNALIMGRAARTAFLTTRGHGDMLILREGGRTNAFDFTHSYPQPFVPRALTHELPERIDAGGTILTPLDEAAVVEELRAIAAKRIEAVAVCLLWSIVNPIHELRVGELIKEHLPDVPYTLSHQLNPAVREFRRASSAVVDAALKPIMGNYMRSLEHRLRSSGFGGRTLIVTSQGGMIDASEAAAAPIRIVNSGPSMAPIAGRFFAAHDSDAEDVIVADTGGTTYDVSIVRRGTVPMTRDTVIGDPHTGIVIGFPWVDVKSVGAGGGSIAHVDNRGLLQVGPASAGAVPGPAAYGRGGTRPTVTDAALVLGYIDPDYFLGGSMVLQRSLAEKAIFDAIAGPLELDLHVAADAILTIATENMVQAILDITVKQGIDPGKAVLIGGGGAAGLNSGRIFRRLGGRELLIPVVGPALSAAGALLSDLRADFQMAYRVRTEALDFHGVRRVLEALFKQCESFVAGPGSGALSHAVSVRVDARYATQVWEIEIDLGENRLETLQDVDAFVELFHQSHETLFSFCDRGSDVEIIGWTATVTCRFHEVPGLRLAPAEVPQPTRMRPAYFAETGAIEVPVLRLEAMSPGDRIEGPAIVESALTTVVIDPWAECICLPSYSLMIRSKGETNLHA